MNKLAISWYQFWRKRKWIFALFMGLLVVVQIIFAGRLVRNEDITKALPDSEEFQKFAKIAEHNGLNKSVYFSVSPKESFTHEQFYELAIDFTTAVAAECGDKVTNIQFELGEDELSFYDFVDHYLPIYLTSNDYQTIEDKIVRDSVIETVKENHQTLFTPEGYFLKDFLIRDPLSLNVLALNKFSLLQDSSTFVIEDGLMMMPDRKGLFITADLAYKSADGKKNEQLANDLEELALNWEDRAEVEYFSPVLISNANAEQIKKDTSLTIVISAIGIALLFFFYYRSILLPLFFLLPVGMGILFALSAFSFIQPEVSAIAIGASAIVLGMIMDYSFHFFTHLKHSSSISETLNEVVKPLLMGCLTTILAFLALRLTNSPVLQDFGLFAALSLIGAVLSVVFVLPIVIPSVIAEKWKNREERSFTIKVPKLFRRLITLAIVGFTVVAVIYAPDIEFDDDLLNLSYTTDELKSAEKKFQNIDSGEEKRVFVLSEGRSKEEALEKNYAVYQELETLKANGEIKSFLNTSIFDLPQSTRRSRIDQWNSFWKKEANDLNLLLDSLELELGYYETTFDHFKHKISGHYEPDQELSFPIISSDISKLVDSTENGWIYISYFTVDVDTKDQVVATLKQRLDDSSVIDRSAIATSLVSVVQDDFNYVLLVSSLLVFITLLIVYGRIELALITFLPMILSWIWILGAAALLDVKFNFVNIIICTFIFGLGDDFAIFVTDGCVKKFSTNNDAIGSYKKGILLSAFSTIIGTGSLIFALHPAIHSVALISVIGLTAIVIISFTIQPYLLKQMLIRRKEKGLPPVSLVNFFSSLLAFSFFVSGCLALWPIQLLFRIIPFGKWQLRLFYHHLIRIFCIMQLYIMVNVRKRILFRERLNFKEPSIIIANHQSFIDIIMMIALNPKLIIMTNKWVYNSPIFGMQIKYLGYFLGNNGVEENEAHIAPYIEKGYSVVIFPEGTRSQDKKINRFHKGAFYLAEKFNMDITPIMLHGFNDTMKKNDFILLNGKLNTVVLPRIKKTDATCGKTYKEECKNIAAYFRKEFKAFDKEHSDSSYLQPKIISNYIFKSPIIEWYVKVKWMLERKNYDLYDSLIKEDARILDLGCGYGYLSYYLQLRSNERVVTGVDYDEDKIVLANNCYSKNEKIHFESADARELEIQDYDAIILYDILHYLPAADQLNLLKKCANGMTPDGVIIIRDGIIDETEKHKRTELTEKYSTKTIGFNKTVNELCFFSKDLIFDFAKEHSLSCEMKLHKKSTSNTLFILKRNT